jgi:tetratricopeptide (TPR) repeat protein
VMALKALAYPWRFPLIYPVDHANTGYILANRGDLEGGLRELAVAEAGLPGTPHLNYDMGRMLLLLGRPGEALARFERELVIAPRHAEAIRRAGVAAKGAGDLDRAARHWEHYLSLAPRGEQADEVRRQLQALSDRQGRTR